MTDIVTRFTCDACLKTKCMNGEVPSDMEWTTKTEVGDLCPSCHSAWETWKSSFIERMRKESGERLV